MMALECKILELSFSCLGDPTIKFPRVRDCTVKTKA